MSTKIQQNRKTSNWLRPWNLEKFNNLYDRDERFFAVLIKGMLSWLTDNILMYNKGISHFIYTTGSSYLYVESNGYKFSMTETSGEDYMYMHMPRCIIEMGDVNIPTEELSAPYVRGQYERLDGNEIKGYNAQIRRLPIEVAISAKYVLSNFNEAIILIQELIDKVAWQQYFNIIYLGQIIQCSIELDNNYQVQMNKVDMESPDTNQKTIEIQYKLCSNYPCIDERTEIENKTIISSFQSNFNLFNNNINNVTDKHTNDITDVGGGNSINLITDNDSLNIMPSTPDGDTFTMGDSNDKEAAILQYKNDTLLKTTFKELKNNL